MATIAEKNKALVRRWLEGHERGMLDFSLLAPDVIDHAKPPGLPPGIEGLKQSVEMLHKALSDWRITVDDMIAEGDKVALHGTGRFKHTGEFLGIPATGRQVTISFIQMWRIKNGKLAEHWHEWNLLNMLQQLGVTPAQREG